MPYHQRDNVRPTDQMRALAGENQFYQLYFQEPGKAEAELEADTRRGPSVPGSASLKHSRNNRPPGSTTRANPST